MLAADEPRQSAWAAAPRRSPCRANVYRYRARPVERRYIAIAHGVVGIPQLPLALNGPKHVTLPQTRLHPVAANRASAARERRVSVVHRTAWNDAESSRGPPLVGGDSGSRSHGPPLLRRHCGGEGETSPRAQRHQSDIGGSRDPSSMNATSPVGRRPAAADLANAASGARRREYSGEQEGRAGGPRQQDSPQVSIWCKLLAARSGLAPRLAVSQGNR